jgi:hypothetical protein
MSSETQRRTRIYVALLAATATLVAIVLVALGYDLVNPWTVLALAVVNALAERGGVWITRTTQMSIALLPTLFAAVLFGPLAGGVVNAASMLGDSELLAPRDAVRAPRLKWATYTSTRFIIGAAAGVVAEVIIGATSSDFGGFLIATLVAAIVAESLDVLSAGVTSRIRGRRVSDVTRTLGPLLLTSIPAYAPIVAILALAYTDVSPWTAPLFFIPALAAQRLFAMYQRERDLAETLSRANLSFAVALVTALEASDAYTAGHSRAVAIYSRDIAQRMGLSDELAEKAFLCGLVHDIGKVGLPPSLLGKDGPLTLEERKLMQRHSEIGERILLQVDAYGDIASIVRFHHERIDGEGYPDRISGDEIPLLSRIIAVADAYNAMTSNRPYREAMPSRVARLRLAQAVETQFDTSAVAAFEAILAASDEAYRTATREDFSPMPIEDVGSEQRIIIQPASQVA